MGGVDTEIGFDPRTFAHGGRAECASHFYKVRKIKSPGLCYVAKVGIQVSFKTKVGFGWGESGTRGIDCLIIAIAREAKIGGDGEVLQARV